MKIIKLIKFKEENGYLIRKLSNGLIEIKEFWDEYIGKGRLNRHYFRDQNKKLQGEYKEYWFDGELIKHVIYKNSRISKKIIYKGRIYD